MLGAFHLAGKLPRAAAVFAEMRGHNATEKVERGGGMKARRRGEAWRGGRGDREGRCTSRALILSGETLSVSHS